MWDGAENRTETENARSTSEQPQYFAKPEGFLPYCTRSYTFKTCSNKKAVSKKLWIPPTTVRSSTVPGRLHTDPPLNRGNGLVPGLIAAGLFICFLLGLYTLLWKCMVSTPKRKQKNIRVRIRDHKDSIC